jgi:peptide/nickel transport system ATP-binding protein
MQDSLLRVEHLDVDYRTLRGRVRAVQDFSLEVRSGEVVGLAGESGSGKSTMALAAMRLIRGSGRVSGGQVWFRDLNVLTLDPAALRRFRWERVSLVLQSAMNSLNPVLTLGEQFDDMFQAHGVRRAEGRERAAELMRLVRIDPVHLRSYPHELSGGMRQRSVIAMALALRPELVVMDEPTTALDVVVERGIVAEIKRLRAELGFSVLFITHDLSLLATLANRIAVMYAGQLVETGPSDEIVHRPRHPYTQALVRSFPRVRGERIALRGIPGSPPDMRRPPSGCRFHPRCPSAMERCRRESPSWTALGPDHGAACHLLSGAEQAQ